MDGKELDGPGVYHCMDVQRFCLEELPVNNAMEMADRDGEAGVLQRVQPHCPGLRRGGLMEVEVMQLRVSSGKI